MLTGNTLALFFSYNAYAEQSSADQFIGAQAALNRDTSRLSDQNEKAGLSGMIVNLKAMSADLDQKQSLLDASKLDLTGTQARLDSAKAKATGLRQQASQNMDWGRNRVQQILNSEMAICSQMGGEINANKCIFSCQSDQMDVCQQKTAGFNQAISEPEQKLADVSRQVSDSEQAATTAESSAEEIANSLIVINYKIDNEQKDLTNAKDRFNLALNDFYQALSKAQRIPLSAKINGPAWKQALMQNQYLKNQNGQNPFGFDCFNKAKCSDLSTAADGSLVIPDAPSAPAGVATSSASYQQTLTQTKALVGEFNSQRSSVIDAIASDAPNKSQLVIEYAKTLSNLGVKTGTLRNYNRYNIDNVSVPSPNQP